jgi:hypothetical protein
MKISDPIKLVSQLVDLPLIDKDNRWCGIVDDVELDGGAGREMRVSALLVGPGAYQARLPKWAYWLVTRIFGDRISRVPVSEIDTISAAVHLKCPAEKVGLHVVENRVRRWIPRRAAL